MMAASPGTARGAVPQPAASVDETAVSRFLLSRKYYLTALELHQELLEGNNGIHNVADLNAFFGSSDKFAALVRATEEKARANKSSCAFQVSRSARAPQPHPPHQPVLLAIPRLHSTLALSTSCSNWRRDGSD